MFSVSKVTEVTLPSESLLVFTSTSSDGFISVGVKSFVLILEATLFSPDLVAS